MTRDTQVFDLIENEKNRQLNGIELIASENFVSPQVMEAQGSVLTNKYAEGLPGKRYYGGCEVVDKVEQLAIDNLKQLFGAAWANVQPHSGANANIAVQQAILKPGDKILGLDLAHGGHLTHGSPANLSGKLYDAYFYTVKKEDGLINYEELEEKARTEKPKLIICGASAYSRDWDYARIRKVADEVGALVWADIAHPSGFIASKLLNDPLPHCHIVTSTTHKTLRGPRGGIIMMGQDFENPFGLVAAKGRIKMMSELLDSSVFPGTQGGPLEHVIAAKAVAFKEALSQEFRTYIGQVQKNARVMASLFVKKEYKIISGGTDNHMFLMDLRNKEISGKVAEGLLGLAGITLNKNMVPYDDKSPFITSGIRIGTSAITTRGLKEADMEKIVDMIDLVITKGIEGPHLNEIKHEIEGFMGSLPLFKEN